MKDNIERRLTNGGCVEKLQKPGFSDSEGRQHRDHGEIETPIAKSKSRQRTALLPRPPPPPTFPLSGLQQEGSACCEKNLLHSAVHPKYALVDSHRGVSLS